jgi:hypothetical protein
MDMVRIEGKQLENLIDTLTRYKEATGRDPYLLRIAWQGESVLMKVNEGLWSAPMGTKQEAY